MSLEQHFGSSLADDVATTTALTEFPLDHGPGRQFPVDTVSITRPPDDGEPYGTVATIGLRTTSGRRVALVPGRTAV